MSRRQWICVYLTSHLPTNRPRIRGWWDLSLELKEHSNNWQKVSFKSYKSHISGIGCLFCTSMGERTQCPLFQPCSLWCLVPPLNIGTSFILHLIVILLWFEISYLKWIKMTQLYVDAGSNNVHTKCWICFIEIPVRHLENIHRHYASLSLLT